MTDAEAGLLEKLRRWPRSFDTEQRRDIYAGMFIDSLSASEWEAFSAAMLDNRGTRDALTLALYEHREAVEKIRRSLDN